MPGWISRISVSVGVLIVCASLAGRRWNHAGGVFDPVPVLSGGEHLKGKWAVVTGANTGLGYEIAKGLVGLRMNVILATRNRASGLEAKERILSELSLSGFSHYDGELVVEQLDQSSFASVRAFADAVAARTSKKGLSSLIANAGIWANQKLTVDEISQTAQVNHYSGFLLVNLLYPLLIKGQGRIVLVSSAMSRSAVDPRSDMKLLDPALLEGRGDKLYGTSKLFNILHAKELARRGPCIVNSVMPGVFPTLLHRAENEPSSAYFFTTYVAPVFYGLIGITAEKAAISSIYLATSVNTSGDYYHGILPRNPPTALANDSELAALLWDHSVSLTKSDISHT